MRKFVLLIFVILISATGSSAHFSNNAQHRIFILDREAARLYISIPAPLLFARELAARRNTIAPLKSEFLSTESVNGVWTHRLNVSVINRDPEAFMRFVADGYEILSGESVLTPKPQTYAIHVQEELPPFATIEDAKAALSSSIDIASFITDAVVDIELDLGSLGDEVSIVNVLPEIDLPVDVSVDNHFLDWKGGGVERREVAGQLREPVVLEQNLPATIGRYVLEGAKHILEGPDHVIFVTCLVLASASIGRLIWAVTGFTIGHSVTLITGFLGFTPSYAWFVPAVEAAIAASIIYAGVIVLTRWLSGPGFAVTTMLGLLHGFGFSFVLADVLGRQSPDFVLSLLSFNIGVEAGQLIIVALVFGILAIAGRLGQSCARAIRLAGASVSIAIAAYWLLERIELVREVI